MGTILLTCPLTFETVSTGIETDAESFAHLPRTEALLDCPSCGGKHRLSEGAWLEEREIAKPRASAA